jgi:hypothetical protein
VAGLQTTITEEEVMTVQITTTAQDDVRRHRRIVNAGIASSEKKEANLDRMLPVGRVIVNLKVRDRHLILTSSDNTITDTKNMT